MDIKEATKKATEEWETRRGELLAKVLGLKLKANGRYNTTGGDKTPLGLYRTAERILHGDYPTD